MPADKTPLPVNIETFLWSTIVCLVLWDAPRFFKHKENIQLRARVWEVWIHSALASSALHKYKQLYVQVSSNRVVDLLLYSIIQTVAQGQNNSSRWHTTALQQATLLPLVSSQTTHLLFGTTNSSSSSCTSAVRRWDNFISSQLYAN